MAGGKEGAKKWDGGVGILLTCVSCLFLVFITGSDETISETLPLQRPNSLPHKKFLYMSIVAPIVHTYIDDGISSHSSLDSSRIWSRS